MPLYLANQGVEAACQALSRAPVKPSTMAINFSQDTECVLPEPLSKRIDVERWRKEPVTMAKRT